MSTTRPQPGTRPSRRRERPEDVTHTALDGVVVFQIGMTLRRPHRVDLWGPVFAAMGRMLTELNRNRAAHAPGEEGDLGFLGATTLVGIKGPWVVQYWRSTEQLYEYARMSDRLHVPAWKAFNAAARAHPEVVGIWHETYEVPAEGIETIYGNGARVGLGAAIGTVPRSARGITARDRLAAGRAAARGESTGPGGAVRQEDLEPPLAGATS